MRSTRRELLKKLRTPVAAAALAAVLLLDWLFLPRAAVAGQLRYDLGILARRNGGTGLTEIWQVRRDHDGLRLVYSDDGGAPPGSLATVFSSFHLSGFWAPTRMTRRVAFEFHPAGDMIAVDREAVRILVADDFARRWPERTAEIAILRASSVQVTANWPFGFMHNALSATAAGALLYSLAAAPTWGGPVRRRRRLRRGLCPRCRYDLRGLCEPTCPECEYSGNE